MLSFDFHLLSFVVLTGVLWVLYKLLLEGRVPVRVVYAYLLVGMVASAGVSMLSPVRLMPPDGTEALPNEPSINFTSASTVGLPLESRICLAFISSISHILKILPFIKKDI